MANIGLGELMLCFVLPAAVVLAVVIVVVLVTRGRKPNGPG